MSILNILRHYLKKRLRIYYRQSEAYWQSLLEGSFRASSGEIPGRRGAMQQKSRGSVLVIDYALPKPDRDAGSRNTFEHMVCLLQLGYEVAFWPYDGLDVPRYNRALRNMGVEVVAGYFRPSLSSWLAARAGQFATVLLNRPQVAEAFLEPLIASGLPIVYYGHDLHCARLAMEAARTGDQEMVRQAEEMQRRERAIWRRVSVSTYPAPEEIVRVAEIDPDVTARHLPAFCFDTFEPRHQAPEGAQIMFVGSFRHPPNISAAQWLARDILPLVRREIPQAHLVIAGAYATEAVKALAGEGVEVVGWLSDADLGALYAASRVAVVPLLVGAGVKLKVVESLHKGVPLVTTSVGAQGLNGLDQVVPVHDDAPAIAAAVTEILRKDGAGWLDKSHLQLDYARKHLSRDAMKSALAGALELAARTKPLE